MVKQQELNLNVPLDAQTKPTLSTTSLRPDLSEASLNLHGDYFRQLQSKLNRHVFWHPFSVLFILVTTIGYLIFKIYDYIELSNSLGDFFQYLKKSNDMKYQITTIFPILVMTFGVVGISTYLISDEFKAISDSLTGKEQIEELYGFDLVKFAKLPSKNKEALSPKELKLLKNGDNTHIITYRESPIAIITLKLLPEKSTASAFYVSITSLNVRKVFAKVDFDKLLLDWAVLRSRQLFEENTEGKYDSEGCKIYITAQAYSFDKDFVKTLKNNHFGLIKESYELSPFLNAPKEGLLTQSIHKAFGIKRYVYGLTITTKSADNDKLLNAANSSSLLKNGRNNNNSIRKRK